MLFNFAWQIPNEIAYPLFKEAIVSLCSSVDNPLRRKGGLKILAEVCDSDALLDPIREDVDLYTNLIVQSLQDSEHIVRSACCDLVGEFSKNVRPDFLE